MEIINTENLSFKYNGENEYALKDISLSISEGDFLLVCGGSGSGKTTLLRLLKREISPYGEITGDILYKGRSLIKSYDSSFASEIGFCFQNPDSQIVTDRVCHELSFGLENMGLSPELIRKRVGEVVSVFGLDDIFYQETDTLSGGQKQLLNIAGLMAMNPKLLLLDEPCAQLDPIASSELLDMLKKLNQDFGVTVIIAEHRLEEAFTIADKVLLMDKGRVRFFESPKKLGEYEGLEDSLVYPGLPSALRIYRALRKTGKCPLNVREGKRYLKDLLGDTTDYIKMAVAQDNDSEKKETAVCLKNISFRYEKNSPDILRDLSMTVKKGELYCLMGDNGSGKTTILKLIAGLKKPVSGKSYIFGERLEKAVKQDFYGKKLSYLPQNPLACFIKSTVEEDFLAVFREDEAKKAGESVKRAADELGIAHLLSRNPLDLSGGELQRCAIAKLLLRRPELLLLDEPTKGIDPASKLVLADILKKLTEQGITILMVTHDIDFAAEYSDTCGFVFDGKIISQSSGRSFFMDNMFYTTKANRISRDILPGAVTVGDVISQAKRIMDDEGQE